eukprot:TRINITY_DN1832_c1_g5_i1.p2 TRINITY_DN1832_c1_g5~~TRINITY_DN1832_c1_g5_i1.p2  ORF type:complete len:152 (+),score=38.55 TRINITY_DN1832_c1_g5_i1:65-520(+)
MGRNRNRAVATPTRTPQQDFVDGKPVIRSVAGTCLESLPSVSVGTSPQKKLAGMLSTYRMVSLASEPMGILTQDRVIVHLSGVAAHCGLTLGMQIVHVNGVEIPDALLDEAVSAAWLLHADLAITAFVPAAQLMPLFAARVPAFNLNVARA